METFGIWNLLKSLLTSDGQPISSPDKAQEKQGRASAGGADNSVSTPSNQPSAQPEPSPKTVEKTNACEEFFLRHERLSHQRKR